MPVSSFFTVEYKETQPLPKKWQWIGPVRIIIILLLAIVVAIINVPLVGYDTISQFQNHYNSHDDHWYHKFVPWYKSLQVCQPATFTVGQELSTNVSLFGWNLYSTTNANDIPTNVTIVPDQNLIYREEMLDRCALKGIVIEIQKQTGTTVATTAITCDFTGDIAILVASFKLTGIVATDDVERSHSADKLLEISEKAREPEYIARTRTLIKDFYYSGQRSIYNLSQADSMQGVYKIAILRAQFCPAYNQSCPNGTPEPSDSFQISINDSVSVNALDIPKNHSVFEYVFILSAAVAIDLGNNRTDNNVLLNETLRSQTLSSEFNQNLGRRFKGQLLSDIKPSKISTPFLCSYQRIKAPSSLVISVFAATFTIISGLWSLTTLMVDYLGSEIAAKSSKADPDLDVGSNSRDENDEEIGETDTLVPHGSTRDF